MGTKPSAEEVSKKSSFATNSNNRSMKLFQHVDIIALCVSVSCVCMASVGGCLDVALVAYAAVCRVTASYIDEPTFRVGSS